MYNHPDPLCSGYASLFLPNRPYLRPSHWSNVLLFPLYHQDTHLSNPPIVTSLPVTVNDTGKLTPDTPLRQIPLLIDGLSHVTGVVLYPNPMLHGLQFHPLPAYINKQIQLFSSAPILIN